MVGLERRGASSVPFPLARVADRIDIVDDLPEADATRLRGLIEQKWSGLGDDERVELLIKGGQWMRDGVRARVTAEEAARLEELANNRWASMSDEEKIDLLTDQPNICARQAVLQRVGGGSTDRYSNCSRPPTTVPTSARWRGSGTILLPGTRATYTYCTTDCGPVPHRDGRVGARLLAPRQRLDDPHRPSDDLSPSSAEEIAGIIGGRHRLTEPTRGAMPVYPPPDESYAPDKPPWMQEDDEATSPTRPIGMKYGQWTDWSDEERVEWLFQSPEWQIESLPRDLPEADVTRLRGLIEQKWSGLGDDERVDLLIKGGQWNREGVRARVTPDEAARLEELANTRWASMSDEEKIALLADQVNVGARQAVLEREPDTGPRQQLLQAGNDRANERM